MLDVNIHVTHKFGMGKLERYLTEAKITQADFAAMVGASQATVSKLINGTAMPSLSLAIRIETETAGAVPCNSWGASRLNEKDAA